MPRSRVASAVTWYRAHPVADAVLVLGALAVLLSPTAAVFWVVVLVGGPVLAAAGMTQRGSDPDDGGSVPIPAPRRPMPDEGVPTGIRPAVLPEGVEPTEEQLRALTDHDLCRAWRTSYVRLQRLKRHPGGTRTAVAAMAAQRARYLDELERRHPEGFAAWLAAGARAPSDPSRYLQRRTPRPTGRDDGASP